MSVGRDDFTPAALAATDAERLLQAPDDTAFYVVTVTADRCTAAELRAPRFARRPGQVLVEAGAFEAAGLGPDRLAAETLRALSLHSLFRRIGGGA